MRGTDLLYRTIELLSTTARLLEKVFAHWSEDNTGSTPLEENNAQSPFEKLDPARQRRLIDSYHHSCPPKRAVLCGENGVSKISKVE